MTEARITTIQTTLSKQMAKPGGRTIVDMERRANERLNRHKGDVMQAIAETITKLEALALAQSEASQAQVYLLASSLLDTGGFFDTGPLYDAGYSLCEASELMGLSGQWHWPSIEVHVRALRLILTNDCKADATSDALMQGLAAIVAKVRAEAEANLGSE